MLDLLAVSMDVAFTEEPLVIERLLDAGLSRYHLRKPAASAQACADILKSLPAKYAARVVLHQHYELVEQYDLGGIHVKDVDAACEIRDCWRSSVRSAQLSRSLHCISDLNTSRSGWDAAFLSPIFPSLSKPGYVGDWSESALRDAVQQSNRASAAQLYALGGIDASRCRQCADMGFQGVVLHGALWQSPDPVEAFKRIRKVML